MANDHGFFAKKNSRAAFAMSAKAFDERDLAATYPPYLRGAPLYDM